MTENDKDIMDGGPSVLFIFIYKNINTLKVAPYSDFNGGLGTKHGVATHAWIAWMNESCRFENK